MCVGNAKTDARQYTYIFRGRMTVQGNVGERLLVSKFITLRSLNDSIEGEDVAVVCRGKD
jgi:hypothetical protein